jgi:hypothetical protein
VSKDKIDTLTGVSKRGVKVSKRHLTVVSKRVSRCQNSDLTADSEVSKNGVSKPL